MYNIFIDGKEGTTGLQIYDRLGKRKDINIISLSEEKRKDVAARKQCLNEADISFLCLPDQAAKESVSLVENPKARIIDASTAHRTMEGWVYGLPEIDKDRRSKIAESKRVANPGCHATGFITLVAPLVKLGLIGADYPLVANSLTGYSGAGKKTIAVYEANERDKELDSPRQYAMVQSHKHLPEMVKECGLQFAPVFNPIICDFYCGMCVSVGLHTRLMNKKYGANDVRKALNDYYGEQNFVKVIDEEDTPSFLAANKLAGTNELHIYVTGNEDRILLSSVFDNLGKGASGAAVQNMNIMLGLDETISLV
jgi:N-acetyl-gamma-glutamyl-phosphate reductase